MIITARKRSLQRLCFYTCLSLCPKGGGVVSKHALHVVSQHALQQRDGIPACFAARGCPGPHLGCPGPHLGGLQAHTRGVSRPTPRGSPGPHLEVSQHALRQTPPAGCCWHPTGMHSCCRKFVLSFISFVACRKWSLSGFFPLNILGVGKHFRRWWRPKNGTLSFYECRFNGGKLKP